MEGTAPGAHSRETGAGNSCIGSVPRRVCESTHLHFEGRWTGPPGLLHRRGGAVRPTPEQADADRVRPMPAVPRARGDVIAEAPRGRRPRCGRDAGVPAHVACNRTRGLLTRAEVSPRGDLATAADYVDRIVPSEPEEHTDRPSHRVDVRSRVRIGA